MRRKALIVGGCIIVAAAALTAGLVAGKSPGSRVSNDNSGLVSAALETSFVTPTGTWAMIPMGELNDPLNTFWQMFFMAHGASRWSLVTPPGVADNGGLAATLGPDRTVVVVFDPTDLLTFSPVSFSSDNGKQWSNGVIPFGVEPVPDAIVDSSGSGTLDALDGGGSQVDTGKGDQQSWTKVVTSAELKGSPATKNCNLVSITALAPSADGEVLGSECADPGVVGILSGTHQGGWTLSGPSLPTAAGEVTVLRISPDAAGTAALVVGHTEAANKLFGMWESPDGKWTVSAALTLAPRTSIVSEGFGVAGELVVETESDKGTLGAHTLSAGAGSPWVTLVTPPDGAKDVSLDADGSIDALCVDESTFSNWRLEDGSWKKIQALDVPIQYGSSS